MSCPHSGRIRYGLLSVSGTFTQLPCLLLSYCNYDPNWHSVFVLLQGKSSPELLSRKRKNTDLTATKDLACKRRLF